MDKFYRNRCIVNLCQTGQLTQAQLAKGMEISPGRVSQLYGPFQEAGEAGLVVKKARGAPPQNDNLRRLWCSPDEIRGADLNTFAPRISSGLQTF